MWWGAKQLAAINYFLLLITCKSVSLSFFLIHVHSIFFFSWLSHVVFFLCFWVVLILEVHKHSKLNSCLEKFEMNKLEFYEFIIAIEDKVWKLNNVTYSNQQIWWRSKRQAPLIYDCDWSQCSKSSNFINGNQQILWIIDNINWIVILLNGLSHVLPLFCNVRKTSYTLSSHVMLVQRHGWDLNIIQISFIP